MNLEKLFEMQRKLDDHILEEHPELKGQNNLDWKILALQVELGECANEWRGFKKWSKYQEPNTVVYVLNPKDKNADFWKCGNVEKCGYSSKDYMKKCHKCSWDAFPYKIKNPLLEEYVDCLHFILSIGLEVNPKEILVEDTEPLKDEFKSVLEAFRHAFNWTVNLDYILFEEQFRSVRSERTYFNLLRVFLTLGEMLGFTWEQVEQAYIQKNEVNHARQESGY